ETCPTSWPHTVGTGSASGWGSVFVCGGEKSARSTAAKIAMAEGVRKSRVYWKLCCVPNQPESPRDPQSEFDAAAALPRKFRLNRLWALARTSLGKFSSTKMYTVAKKQA